MVYFQESVVNSIMDSQSFDVQALVKPIQTSGDAHKDLITGTQKRKSSNQSEHPEKKKLLLDGRFETFVSWTISENSYFDHLFQDVPVC